VTTAPVGTGVALGKVVEVGVHPNACHRRRVVVVVVASTAGVDGGTRLR
jgi:hypothetical protein